MRTTRRIAGLAVVACLGCGFDSGGANDSANLGSSASGTSPTSGSDSDDGGSTGSETADAASGEADETSFGGSTSVGTEEACIDSCVAQVPAGWLGPFYAADAANEIDCPAGYPFQDLGFLGLQAQPATCECSCSAAAGSCEVEFLMGGGSCIAGLAFQLGNGECTPLNTAGFDVFARPAFIGSPAACTPNVTQNTPDPQWDTTTTLCAAPARGGDCGGERCTAPPPEGVATRLCVAKEGEVECPGGTYGQRTVLFRGVNDQRTCTDCNCQGQAACEGQAFAHDSNDCSDSAQPLPFNACTDIDVSGGYAIAAAIVPGTCEATQATPAGEATPTNPLTICCES